MTKKTLVIIPTYNEKKNAPLMIQEIFKLYPDIQLLMIDDGSPDGTGAIIKKMTEEFSGLHLVERTGKLGLGTAYIKGFKWALAHDFDQVVTMDCDFSHDPASIKEFIQALETYDLAIGSRYIGGIRIMNWPMKRLLLSYFASLYARIITGSPFSDATGGFNAYTAKALKALKLDSVFSIGYAFQIELKYKIWAKGFPHTEVPITFYERTEGVSKMSRKIVFEAVVNVLILRFRKMIRNL
jgi:dolichol-phosphate mannosyltransferase